MALDAAAGTVHEGLAHVKSLDGSDAPQELQALAHTLSAAAALFAGVPDVVHLLRWKGIDEKVWHSLDRCARGATVLDQLARANA